MLWHIELKFCTWLCSNVLQIKFECRQFVSIFVGVMPLLELKILQIHSFRTFLLHALTYWVEILHMDFFYCITDQVRVSIFVWVMPLLELRILKIYSFCTFFWHALTYWAENLRMALFYWNKDKLRLSSICVNFLWELCLLELWNTWNTQFTFLLHALAYWAEIFHATFFNPLAFSTPSVWNTPFVHRFLE